MFVEETKHDGTQIALLGLQVKRVRGIGNDYEFVIDARFLQCLCEHF
jgi:hypothetical protein